MKLEKDDAKLGILVALTLALFVGFIFQRSLAALLRRPARFRVLLESAADLADGTEVQLQGLRVGQVDSVELLREGVQYRFLARLALRGDIVLWEGTRVEVVSRPLGGAYLDLQLPPPGQRQEVLGPGSVLAGSAGPTLSTLVEDIDLLALNLNRGVDELRGQLQEQGMGAVLGRPEVREVLDNLNRALRTFQQLGQDGVGLVRQGGGSLAGLDRALAALDQDLAQVHALLEGRSADLDAIVRSLTGALQEVQGLGSELRAVIQQAGPDAGESLKSMDRALRSAEELLELLKAKPNRLVWGRPSQAEKDAAAARVDAARKAQGAKQ